MTGLLVSVRNAMEAEAALAGGASVIDIKEPDRGALGAADPQVWREVLKAVGSRVPVSAALGELLAHHDAPQSAAKLAEQTAGLAFAKVGLADAAVHCGWREVWKKTLASLPASVAPVAVAYADWRSARAPRPEEVIEIGARLGCRTLLVDTFDKNAGILLGHVSRNELRHLKQQATDHGMRLVLAGSLTVEAIREVLPLRPALIAVRGAACAGHRGCPIDVRRVRALAAVLSLDASMVVEAPAA